MYTALKKNHASVANVPDIMQYMQRNG